MAKHLLDKYYTPVEDAKRLIDITLRVLQENGYEISEVIEPSAGNGSFSHQIDCTAYDIEPEADDIIKTDFLKLPLEYKKGRLFIGNPPFGGRDHLYATFYKKCVNFGDYVAFVLPITCLDNSVLLYEFDLIYSEDLGRISWSGREKHCCFNIYARRKDGKLNEKQSLKLKDVTILQLRRGDVEKYNYIINTNSTYGICCYGWSCGKKVDTPGKYVKEIWFWVHKEEYKQRVINLLQQDKILATFRSIRKRPSLSINRLYKYLADNIEGIE